MGAIEDLIVKLGVVRAFDRIDPRTGKVEHVAEHSTSGPVGSKILRKGESINLNQHAAAQARYDPRAAARQAEFRRTSGLGQMTKNPPSAPPRRAELHSGVAPVPHTRPDHGGRTGGVLRPPGGFKPSSGDRQFRHLAQPEQPHRVKSGSELRLEALNASGHAEAASAKADAHHSDDNHHDAALAHEKAAAAHKVLLDHGLGNAGNAARMAEHLGQAKVHHAFSGKHRPALPKKKPVGSHALDSKMADLREAWLSRSGKR